MKGIPEVNTMYVVQEASLPSLLWFIENKALPDELRIAAIKEYSWREFTNNGDGNNVSND
jgi:hypothetical protein